MTIRDQRSRQTLENLKSNISKTVRDREMCPQTSNSIKKLTPDDLLKFKGQGQTLKTLKSYMSKMVRDSEKVSMEVRKEVMHGLTNNENILTSGDIKF